MNNEFKKIKTKNEIRFVLETASVGATGASAIATSPASIGELRKRLKELKDKISVPTTKPRNPAGMGSTPGRGTQVHKDKKHDQKMGKEKHKKPFYEQMIDEIEALAELEKPSGSLFLKFRGKRLPGDEMMLLGYGGFGTTPKDVNAKNAVVKPFQADDAYDVINKIESIFKDQDFIGVEKIVLDIPNSLAGQLRDVLDYAEQDPERFELYTGDDSEEPEAKTGGKVIGIGPDGKRIDRSPPKAQVGGSSRGIASTGMVTVQADSTGQKLISGLVSQGKLSRDTKVQGNKITLRKDDYSKMMSVLGNAKFQQMFTKVGSVAEAPVNELSKDTLRAYSKDAGREVGDDQRDARSARDKAIHHISHGDLKKGADWSDEADWLNKRAEKRAGGIARATTKLAQKGIEEGDEPDHEISMASSELQSIAADAANLLDIVKQRSEEEGLEAWQQSKITKAADFMNSVLQSIRGDEEQGVAEGSENLSYKKGWKLCDKDPSADPQHLFRRHGEGLDRNQFIKGFNDNAKSRGMSIYGDVSGDVDHSTLRYKEFKRDQGVAEGYSELDNLQANFEATINRILDRAKAEGRGLDQLTDREKKAIAILKGKDQGVTEVSSSFQGKLDREKADFKRRELDAELGDEGNPNQNYRSASPPPKGMYFYNVSPGQERLAQMVGLKQTKSGKWYSKYPNPEAGGKFGPGKYWEPKAEGVAEGPEENKKWRDQARDASKEKRPWSPTNLPNYKKSKEQGVAEEDDPLAAREKYAQQYKTPGKVYKPTHAGDKKGMTKAYAYDIKRTGPKGQLPKEDVEEGLRDPKDNPCWKGYKPVGTKKKGGKTVPNCVPTNEDAYINQLMAALESKK